MVLRRRGHPARRKSGDSPRVPPAKRERSGRSSAAGRDRARQRIVRRPARPQSQPGWFSVEPLAGSGPTDLAGVRRHRLGEHNPRPEPTSRPDPAAPRHDVSRRAFAARPNGEQAASNREKALPSFRVFPARARVGTVRSTRTRAPAHTISSRGQRWPRIRARPRRHHTLPFGRLNRDGGLDGAGRSEQQRRAALGACNGHRARPCVPTRRPHLHAARTGAGDPGDAVRRGDAVGRADDRAGRGDEVVGRADGWVETARGPPRSSTLSSESPPAEDDDGDGGDTSPVNAGGPRDGTVGIPGTSPMPPGRTSANSRGKSAAGTTASTHAPSASRAKTRRVALHNITCHMTYIT
jgi:hypothetical protein